MSKKCAPGYWRNCHDIAEAANVAMREEIRLLNIRIASLEADIKCAWSTCRITDAARMKAEKEKDGPTLEQEYAKYGCLNAYYIRMNLFHMIEE